MSRRKLLLADDSVTIQKVINLTFADEGIDVISVGDGESALQKVFETRPDLVMADVHMPGPSGYEICEKIRNVPDLKDLPVVLLVGSFEPFDENEAKRVGANAYLTKPFQSIRQLVSQISDLMEASRPENGVEVLAEHDAEPAGPETDDIENLYRESITESLVSPALHGEAGFVDAGMDDEIIQTSYSVKESAENDDLDIEQYIPQESSAAPVPDASDETQHQSAPAIERTENATIDQFAQTVEMPLDAAVGTSAAQADASAAPDEQRRPENSSPAVEQEPAAAYEPEIPAAEQPAGPKEQPGPAAVGGPDLDLDEIELLELPSVGSDQTIEFTTPEATESTDSGTKVVSLTPELMEVIVQKVVERLSEKY